MLKIYKIFYSNRKISILYKRQSILELPISYKSSVLKYNQSLIGFHLSE